MSNAEGAVAEPKTPSQDKDWKSKVRDIAEASDRWFVSIARGLDNAAGFAARKARVEAEIVADSAQKAADTTLQVGMKLVGGLSTPARAKTTRQGVLLRSLRDSIRPHADRLDAIDEDQFRKLLEELRSQVSFELQVLPPAGPESSGVDNVRPSADDPEVIVWAGSTRQSPGESVSETTQGSKVEIDGDKWAVNDGKSRGGAGKKD
jgi:hypothetical protein